MFGNKPVQRELMISIVKLLGIVFQLEKKGRGFKSSNLNRRALSINCLEEVGWRIASKIEYCKYNWGIRAVFLLSVYVVQLFSRLFYLHTPNLSNKLSHHLLVMY